ncbi:hypothetical protein [Nocardia cyriacigeorgica]|uniref:Uncharacterized protein n=1 Tax=Nocardia cyriacigeorgica TaxID=135487 RepID=A0A6P1D8U1_9NOCA|nr:hypothetical protein [Nocardia cyriacigeorgica]NEW47115.1 hypothetical protein [Nocardia cyriacigeorgica]
MKSVSANSTVIDKDGSIELSRGGGAFAPGPDVDHANSAASRRGTGVAVAAVKSADSGVSR